MKEVELKFQVPPAARQAVESAVAGSQPGRRMRLQAAYFDTPKGALAGAGLALRLRKEGRAWVQTLKGALPDGTSMTRSEHNVPRTETGAVVPEIDPRLHAGTPVGEALLTALQRADGELQRVMGTDIWRRARIVRVPGGAVELAFDVGVIEAGPADAPRRLPVCELEIELKRGHPQAVVGAAQRWVMRHGLWLDTRTKAELGNLLVRDVAMATPRRASEVILTKSMSPAEALDAVLRSCLEQISVNASQIASGTHSPEHIHQLRVGLRRLRTALRFFDGARLIEAIDSESRVALSADAASLFRQLGEARDRDAVSGPLAIELARALVAVGQAGDPPSLPASGAEIDPAVLVRHGSVQRLMLNLIARVHSVPPAVATGVSGRAAVEQPLSASPAAERPEAPLTLRKRLALRLNRWHRQILVDAERFDSLDDEGRHRLRKHIKRLRYAAEFSARVFDERSVRRYLKGLRALQERLGTVNDVAVGVALFSAAAPTDARALFALGWLAAQRERALLACRPDLKRFVVQTRFWRVRRKKTGSK
ncbi:MAG: CHAD domain-containing protein [Burkholderiaceae bacterium]|nr:CHAD domain-containing protein [Burkholderiaceae bacterium]